MFLRFAITLVKLLSVFKICIGTMENDVFLDVNDILSENLMPATWLFSEVQAAKMKFFDNSTGNGTMERSAKDDDGSLTTAMSTMGFHRYLL